MACLTWSDIGCPRVWVVARLRGYGVRIRVRVGSKEGGDGAGDRQGRKEANRLDTGSGQRKAPQGEPYGASGGLAYLSATVPGKGAEGHQGDEESAEKEIA